MLSSRVSLGVLLAVSGFGCQTFSASREDGGDEAPIGVSNRLIDTRPVTHSSTTPLPISGGTLLALADGQRVLVSDPERDRILIVALADGGFHAIALGAGAEPGRAVEDKNKHAYVVLRGTGEILTIDLATNDIAERRRVCALPRGIAVTPTGDGLAVACAEGKLVELPLNGVGGLRETQTAQDVRDVVFTKDKLFVSRFRSAELVELDAHRAQKSARRLPDVADHLRFDSFQGIFTPGVFEPAVAWRTVAHPSGNGAVVMVHQRATVEDIDVDPHATPDDAPPADTSYGGGGGGMVSSCGGIVHSAVTIIDGDRMITSPQLGGVVLPVDVAVSSGGVIAVASAGGRDLDAPSNQPFNLSSSVKLLTAADIDRARNGECLDSFSGTMSVPISAQAVAVAFTPSGQQLIVQTREPAGLVVIDNLQSGNARPITLGGDSRADTGHEIFHRDAGGGIACASCHVEGTDDGRVWHFTPIGARRTQPVDVGLRGTEPFHWDGTLPTMDRLMNEVFVSRMGGPRESAERVGALSDWVFQIPSRAPLRPVMDEQAGRGKALFESGDVGCATCHSGPKLTNNRTVDVGTGVALQVPSLVGVSQRLPLMHNGCAKSLLDRFDASCGGTAHGNVAQLSQDQLGELVAYLETL